MTNKHIANAMFANADTALSMLAAITAEVEARRAKATHASTTYASVGNLEHAASLLSELAEFLGVAPSTQDPDATAWTAATCADLVTFKTTQAAAWMICLDDDTMYNGEFTYHYIGAARVEVQCSKRAAKMMLDNWEDRADVHGGYDHSAAQRRSAATAAVAVATILSRLD